MGRRTGHRHRGSRLTDLIVRGGTVVSAAGRRTADVAVEAGQIVAVEEQLAQSADVREIDARGMLILPGVVDVHTHTRVATDEQPDRFFEDSVAAAFGGTTTFLAFNNPGTGSQSSESLISDAHWWRAATASDSAVDFGLAEVITNRHTNLDLEIAGAIDLGVASFKAFMVFDFGVGPGPLTDALKATARHNGLLAIHGEDRPALEANIRRLLEEGKTQPRFHAAARPPAVEAAGTRLAVDLARAADAPAYLVHLSCAAAVAELPPPAALEQSIFGETVPHFLALDESVYDLPDEDCARYVISPPMRSVVDRESLWLALSDGRLATVASDHVPDRLATDKANWRDSFDKISNGGPGIETLLSIVYSEGVAKGRITVERLVDLLSTTPARLFGLNSKGAIEVGRDADIVIFDPAERRTLNARELHHTSDYTPYEGLAVAGGVVSTLVRGEFVVREGHFVGRRGYGQLQERRLAWR